MSQMRKRRGWRNKAAPRRLSSLILTVILAHTKCEMLLEDVNEALAEKR